MNDCIENNSTRHTVLLLLTGSVIFSFFLASGLFMAAAGSLTLRGIVFGAVVLIPQTAVSFFLYRRITGIETAENKMAGLLCLSAPSDIPDRREDGQPAVVPVQKTADTAEKNTIEKLSAAGRSIVTRSRLLFPVVSELCSSISHDLSSTTEPISAELLRIRQTNETFLNGIRSYEGEVKDRSAIIRLQDESASFDRDLKALSGTVQDVFAMLDGHITKLKTVSDRIGGIAEDIGEVSEQIRILSFNASIEAARAGNAGRGFHVIAGEIKRLSADTESRLEEIQKTLKETRNIFGDIESSLEENKARMLGVVTQRQAGFSVFEQMLEDYFPKLEKLYTGVTGIIASLSKSMDVISPVVQLHEITSQEIGNLGLVAGDFFGYIRQTAEDTGTVPVSLPGQEEISAVAADIRRRLTTENELKALGKGIRESVPEADIDLGINSRDIELF